MAPYCPISLGQGVTLPSLKVLPTLAEKKLEHIDYSNEAENADLVYL
jgi:hypothetical protein